MRTTSWRAGAAALAALAMGGSPAAGRAVPPAVSGPPPRPNPAASADRPILTPSKNRGATLAGIVASAQAWSRPGGGRRVWHVETETSWSGEPQVLLVLRSAVVRRRTWLEVLLPIRPDGAVGWIERDHAVLMRTRYWVLVDKHARRLTVYRSGRKVRELSAVIGKPATPTPDGLAAIYERDRQADPHGFLGTWALPLTTFSHVLFNFGGGPGRVAIHGRGGASLHDPLGSARSHGCIRVDNSDVDWMAAHLPQGTPVQITG